MDRPSALRELGLAEGASLSEIKSAYRRLVKIFHPDVRGTGDSGRFVVISSAYLFLVEGGRVGEVPAEFSEEVSSVLNLKTVINQELDQVVSRFKRDVDVIEKDLRADIREQIFSSSSTSELKTRLDGCVKRTLLDASAQVEGVICDIEARFGRSQSEAIFKIFKSQYQKRRQDWLLSLYHNPATLSQIVLQPILYVVRSRPDFGEKWPEIWKLFSLVWVAIACLFVSLTALVVQFALLDPRKQFLPPRLSVQGIRETSSDAKNGIGHSSSDLFFGGSLLGGALGTLVLPGLGTIVGALIGSMLSFGGKSLETWKEKAFTDVTREVSSGFRNVVRAIEAWAERSKYELHEAALGCFAENCRKSTNLVRQRALPGVLLALPKRSIKK